MFTSRKILLVSAALVLVSVNAVAVDGPQLGQSISLDELTRWDISIPPDGKGLPEGSGTAAIGQPIYQAKCLACHGEKGQNGPHDQLVGGTGSLVTERAVKTVGSYWPYATTLFDYIRRAMPYHQPRTLTDAEVYSLTAYLLYLNEIISETTVLNQDTLPQIKMPNRDSFIPTEDVK